MAKLRFFRSVALLVLSICLLAGCGSRTYPVSGTVRLDGQLVADAGVLLQPVAGGPTAHGTTDAEGRFDLVSANRRGLPPGEYRVVVTKQKVSGIREDETVEPGGIRIQWLIPQRYNSPDSSGISVTVPSDKYDLELSSK